MTTDTTNNNATNPSPAVTIALKGRMIANRYEWSPPGVVHWGFSEYGVPPSAIASFETSFEVTVPVLSTVACEIAAIEREKVAANQMFREAVERLNERLAKLRAIECSTAP